MVHVITTIERGGAENAVLALSKIQVKNGYEVTVVPLKGKFELKEALEASGVNIDTSIAERSFMNQIFLMRNKFLDNSLFHAHLPRAELLMRLSKSRHGFYVTRHNTEAFFPKSSAFISRLLSRLVLQKSLGVISISKAVKRFLLTTKEMSPRTRNTVIYYGYTPRIKQTEVAQPVFRRNGSKIKLGTIGRLVPQKNLGLLLEFANLLKVSGINFQISVVGEGPDRSLLENRLLTYRLNHEVQFLGKVSDVSRFLSSLDFFVFTSNYEGLGLVLLEAMDAGLPIIAPRNSAIPEVIGENHPGLFESGNLLSLSDTFMAMLSSQSMQEKALEIQSLKLSSFDMEICFRSHHDFYATDVYSLSQ